MPDPRLCCAAEICCPPPQAREAKVELIGDLLFECPHGVVTVHNIHAFCQYFAIRMKELDIEFAPGELMRAIRNLADHPNSKVKERGGNISAEAAEGIDLNSAE